MDIVTGMLEGREGIARLFRGLLRWRVGLGYILFSTLAPIALFTVSPIVSRSSQGKWPGLSLLGQVDYLPYLGVIGALQQMMWLKKGLADCLRRLYILKACGCHLDPDGLSGNSLSKVGNAMP